LNDLKPKLAQLENEIHHEFMGGHHLTIGDISIFFELGLFLILFKYDLQEHYPKLHKWFDRVSTHEVVV